MIRYKCPECGAVLESDPSLAGRKDQCPLCGRSCTVPAAKGKGTLALGIVGAVLVLGAAGVLIYWMNWGGEKRSGGDRVAGGAADKGTPRQRGEDGPVSPRAVPATDPAPPVAPKPEPAPPVAPQPQPEPKPPVKPPVVPPSGTSADWAQWRGPRRDGVSTETGLLKEWPEGGPTLAWKAPGFGPGYSSVAIAGGRLYTMGDIAPAGGRKEQYVIAMDLATRNRLWTAKVGQPHGDGGPRCTPTVDAGLVYALGTDGDLVCVEADTGKERWRKSFASDFPGSRNPGWRYSESPLVDGERLICTPGSPDALLAALDKKTGDVIWQCSLPESERRGGPHAQYASIVATEAGGVRQYVQLIASLGLVGVSAADGKFLWSYRRIVNGTANCSTAVVRGDNVFCSTAYGTGAALLKLTSDSAEQVYFLDSGKFQSHHGGFVLLGDCIYGGHGHGAGAPTCIELKTGKVMWQARQPGGGSGAMTCADGNLYFQYEDGTVALVEATPKEYKLKGKLKLARQSGPAWPHPVVCGGKLYCRWADTVFCYDVKAP